MTPCIRSSFVSWVASDTWMPEKRLVPILLLYLLLGPRPQVQMYIYIYRKHRQVSFGNLPVLDV